MREILFRGKTTDGGWVYGSYIPSIGNEKFCAIKDNTPLRMVHLCKSETVGQYTGLTDKNGDKIFEGDIVWGDDCTGTWHKGVVEYDDSIGSFIINSKRFMQYSKNENHYDLLGCWTVEGNIYDGHESLEGDTNG